MCQGAAGRLLNRSDDCQVRKVASLLAQALSVSVFSVSEQITERKAAEN
jgi:hypothetical protein